MKPGRELDALVAEKVMGWREIDTFWDHRSLYNGCLMGCPDLNSPGRCEVPSYSTDIAAAWAIVEKFDNLVTISGPHASIAGEYENGGHWDAEIKVYTAEEKYVKIISEEGETAPHAICLTALKAVGALEEK